jgi:hypothetical protein
VETRSPAWLLRARCRRASGKLSKSHVAATRRADHDPPLLIAKMAGYAFGSNPPGLIELDRKYGLFPIWTAGAHSISVP